MADDAATRAVAERLYAAFAARDWQTMGALYADDARFHDPVFLELDADETRAMWRMLLERATDLHISARVLDVQGERAEIAWTASYLFARTGRRVRNQVRTHLHLKDGRVVRQVDSFSLWRWSAMALGPAGWLLGWTIFVRGKIRDDARTQLTRYRERLKTS